MSVQVGQVYEDTYMTTPRGGRWLVRVMKLNAKSARVEPCEDNGWHALAGYPYQYRMEFKDFERGRMRLVADLNASRWPPAGREGTLIGGPTTKQALRRR